MSQENFRKETCRDELQYIGLRISYFRKMRNMTQAQLAEKSAGNFFDKSRRAV